MLYYCNKVYVIFVLTMMRAKFVRWSHAHVVKASRTDSLITHPRDDHPAWSALTVFSSQNTHLGFVPF